MSLALASSVSTSRCIGAQYYNNRRHVVTPIPQRRSKKEKSTGRSPELCTEISYYFIVQATAILVYRVARYGRHGSCERDSVCEWSTCRVETGKTPCG